MKKSIKIFAIALVSGLFTTGVYAADKATTDTTTTAKDDVTIETPATKDCNVDVAIHKVAPGKSQVVIYDGTNTVVYKDALSKDAEDIQKSYNFSGMEDGNYTIEVTTNDETVERTLHVYSDENDQKVFLLQE